MMVLKKISSYRQEETQYCFLDIYKIFVFDKKCFFDQPSSQQYLTLAIGIKRY